MTKFEQFLTGYIECLYFVDTGDTGEPFSELTLSPQAHEHINEICKEFWDKNEHIISDAVCYGFDVTKEQRAGFDFYLTRHGHGAGFWDGDWSEPHATQLTDASGDAYDHVYEDTDGYISISV